jgi:tetratricopeptide (TPR) repeat protein
MQMELGAPMAEAYCAQGRLDEATRIIADTLALTQATGARHYEAALWRVQGQLCATQGMAAEAALAFDQAIMLCEAIGNRLELARALYQRGALQRMHDDLEAANADWARACTLCTQMGARALLCASMRHSVSWRSPGSIQSRPSASLSRRAQSSSSLLPTCAMHYFARTCANAPQR